MDRKELGLQLHKEKYNCAQCVACTFKDKIDMDESAIFKAAEAFGFGMGSMETCGAVSGMALVIGLLNSDGNLENPTTKKVCYNLMAQATKEFKEKNSSIVCRELKGVDTGKVLRSCDGCIGDAIEILEGLLK